MTHEFPDNNEESIPQPVESGYDISGLDGNERTELFKRLTQNPDEKWASEALEIDQPFSVGEQELLVSMISDP